MTQLDLPEKEHSMRVECIIGTVSAQHKDWLIDKLRYSNEVNLRRRLKEILLIYKEIIVEFFPTSKERKNLIGKITEYRNALTHFDPMKEQPSDDDIYGAYLNIKLIVELCLLTELGFDTSDILRLMKKETE